MVLLVCRKGIRIFPLIYIFQVYRPRTEKFFLFRTTRKSNRRKPLESQDTIDADGEDENNKDFWTKYYW